MTLTRQQFDAIEEWLKGMGYSPNFVPGEDKLIIPLYGEVAIHVGNHTVQLSGCEGWPLHVIHGQNAMQLILDAIEFAQDKRVNS